VANPKASPFDDDPGEPGADELAEMGEALHHHIQDFAEQHELTEGVISLLLLEVAVKWRMTDYALSVEKPSSSGLKLELDRMRRELEELLRSARRNSDEFIAHAKDVIAQAEKNEQAR
jgi:hypothetical protein